MLEPTAVRGNLIWLASYFKSGNTWVRALLTRYCLAPGEGGLLGAVPWISSITARSPLDFLLGVPTECFLVSELLELRSLYHEELSRIYQEGHLKYFKTHDAFVRTPSGRALFSRTASQQAVYLLRNPLDVAVSFACHEGVSLDAIIETMNAPRPSETLPLSLAVNLASWSDHVTGWCDQDEVPVLVLRYEDILADPRQAFARVLESLGLPIDPQRLDETVQACSFSRLKAEEAIHGFKERPATMASFFREGRSGQWRQALSSAQVDALLARHAPVMRRFGYLDKDDRPV